MKMISELFIKQKTWFNFVSFSTEHTLVGKIFSKRIRKTPCLLESSEYIYDWQFLSKCKLGKCLKLHNHTFVPSSLS